MPSSHRIIKATQAYSGTRSSMIDTLMETLEEERLDNKLSEDSSDQTLLSSKIHEARKKSEEIIQEAEQQSQQLLETAQKQAEELKQSAQAEGYELGQQTGYQEGFERGLQEGLEKARQESESMKQHALQIIQEAHAEIQQYQSQKKDELLELAVRMAEKLVHDQLEQSRDGVLSMAKPFLYQLDKEEEFVTLSVHPDSVSIVKEHLDEVKAINPGTRFMVLPDADLEEHGLIIESTRAVVDLQIKKQLDAMLKELKEMERTADV